MYFFFLTEIDIFKVASVAAILQCTLASFESQTNFSYCVKTQENI